MGHIISIYSSLSQEKENLKINRHDLAFLPIYNSRNNYVSVDFYKLHLTKFSGLEPYIFNFLGSIYF